MRLATVTSKGQITIPKPIRDQLGVAAGDRIAFVDLPDGSISLVAASEDLLALGGMVKPSRRGVTLADMRAAVRARASQRAAHRPHEPTRRAR